MKQFLSFILVIFSLTLYAQDGNQEIEKQAEKMIKMYEMNPEQAQQYKQILSNKFADLEELKNSPERGLNSMEKLMEISKKYDESIMAILDERQIKIFKIQNHMAEGVMKTAGQPEKN